MFDRPFSFAYTDSCVFVAFLRPFHHPSSTTPHFRFFMPLRRAVFIALFLILPLVAAAGNAVAGRLLGERIGGGFMGLNITPPSLSYDYKSPPTPQMGEIVNSMSASTATIEQQGGHGRFAGAMGFRLSPQWRVEGELSYSAAGVENGGERESRLALMNFYYDINTGNRRIQPFLSFGAGVATHDVYRGGMDGLGLATETMSGMAWQVGAGLNYQLNNDLSLSGGYRHIGGDAVEGNGYSIEPDGHEIRIGVRYKFPKPKAVPYDLDKKK